jgi:uncharacterized protein with HEPN domain
MNEKDEFYLKNILEMILDIKRFLTGLDKAGFLKSDLHQNAVMKKLENIGEATKHVSDNLKAKNPDIEWRKISGMRDVLIHDYLGTDLEEVWKTVMDDLPVYKKQVEKLLN